VLLEAARRLQSLGIDVDAKRIEFHLVGKGELASITGNNSQETKGFTDYFVERGPFGKVHEETIKVYLLYGMPRAQMTGTAAHELMHVWQFQRGHLDQERALSEGSCNFASYLVLRKVGGPEAEFIIDAMLKDPDRTYGQGFRTVKAYAEENGISAWLHVLKEKHPDLSTR
jgi:hypothetical protein